MNYNEKCKEIYNRSREVHVAVFAVQGDVYVFDAYTPEFEETLANFPSAFVGIYNQDCTLKMIQDDIL